MIGCFWNEKFIWAIIQFDLAYTANSIKVDINNSQMENVHEHKKWW